MNTQAALRGATRGAVRTRLPKAAVRLTGLLMLDSDSRRNAVLLLLPPVLLALFMGVSWWRDERARAVALAQTLRTDVRFKLAPPVTLREFSETEAQQRRMNLDALRLTFRASLQEEIEAELRDAINKGTFAPPVVPGVDIVAPKVEVEPADPR